MFIFQEAGCVPGGIKNGGQKLEVSSQKPPQARGAWPIIGHLHQLASPQPTYKVLADMADKYGPIFQLRLGAHQFVVVSDSQIAKQCFTTNDRALAGRPKAIASEIDHGIQPRHVWAGSVRSVLALCPQGCHARATVQPPSRGAGRVLESGIRSFTQDIHRTWLRDKNESEDIKLDMKELFGKLIMDIMIQMLFGQRPEEERRQTVVTVKRLYDLLGASALGDFVPWLRWLDIGGHEKAMKETAKEMDTIMESWLQDHKTKRNTKSKEEDDFMDGLRAVQF
nr:cytochrome P450 CYP82D47-like [Ipomoea trifida]